MKENQSRRILKYVSILILAVLVFNAGVFLGRNLFASNQPSINAPSGGDQEIPFPNQPQEPSSPNVGEVMNDDEFVSALRESFNDQARVEAHPEYEGVFVVPTGDDFIGAINSAFSDGDGYNQWHYIVDSFVEISTYTNLNIYLLNPYNEELMLLWVYKGSVYYDFIQDDSNPNNDSQNLYNDKVLIGRSLV